MGDLSTHFWHKDRRCPCGCDNEIDRPELLSLLEAIRSDVGIPMQINSWTRCKEHNSKVGGRSKSAHLRGWALDIQLHSDSERFKFVKSAMSHGCRRIFTGKKPFIVHVDLDPSLPAPRLGLY